MEGENVKKYLVLGNLLIRHKENFWFIYRLLEIFSAAEEFSYFSIKKKSIKIIFGQRKRDVLPNISIFQMSSISKVFCF